MADRVSSLHVSKRKNHAISKHICVDHYIPLLKYLSNHIQLQQTVLIDQLDRSNATCPFKFPSSVMTEQKSQMLFHQGYLLEALVP